MIIGAPRSCQPHLLLREMVWSHAMDVSWVRNIERAERRPTSLGYARGEALVEESTELLNVRVADIPDPFSPQV